MADAEDAPQLPVPRLRELQRGICLLEPLSRRGYGPGLIVLVSERDQSRDPLLIEDGVPSPLVKWAEEGYTVVEVQAAVTDATAPLRVALDALNACDKCQPQGKVGLVGYDCEIWNAIAPGFDQCPEIVGAVVYADASTADSLVTPSIPCLQHFAGKTRSPAVQRTNLKRYEYAAMDSFKFATPFQNFFHYSTESVSHTRSLTFLKKLMDGPHFDLEAIWDEHTRYEFEERSVEKTMATMVQEPYVNHIPTMTGGIGRANLTNFYRHNFVFNNPDDVEMELVSRTVGIDRVVDEFIFKFTHTTMMDWILPGVPPTGRRVEVPFSAVVNIRGDRLYHEHIAWDQASVLSQLDLIPAHVPWPYAVENGVNGKKEASGYDIQLPIAGIDSSQKMRDKNSIPSNQMFAYGLREARSSNSKSSKT